MVRECMLACLWLATPLLAANLTVKLPIIESSDLHFAHISFDDGSSPRNIRQILQDDQGFLWFGTQDGLKRFDGYHFRDYRYDGGTPGSLSGTTISSLFKDHAGKIWVSSDQFLDRYDPTTERFTGYRSDPGDSHLFQGEVNQVNQDSTGIIWLATTQELTRLDLTTGKTIRYQHRKDDPLSLSGNQVKSTFEEKNGTFWVATTEGLDIFDRQTGHVTGRIPIHTLGNKAEAGFPIRFLEDHEGNLWVTSSFGPGLALVDRKARKLTVYSLAPPGQENSRDGVEALLEDQHGTLWVGSSENGLLKFDRKRKEFIRYRNNRSDPDSLSSDRVNSLYEDREGNMWVGTQGGGINRFASRAPPFTRYRHEPGNPNSLEKDEATSVYQDSRGILWVGNRSALNRIDRKTGQYTVYRTAGGPGNLSNTYVLSIIEDPLGYLWFGTSGGGLNRFDRRTEQFKTYRHDPADPNSVSDDIVYCLFVDHAGTLWAGTADGLDRFDPATESFRAYKVGAGLSSYRTIAEDARGNLWLSTVVAGVQRFDPVSHHFTFYQHTASQASLSNDWVNAVSVDQAGIVWAGTLSGLNRLDPVTGVVRAYYVHDGLPNSNVASMVVDEHGNLWLGTSRGLSRFNPRENKFINYYASDGVAGNELYRRNGAWRSPSGEMFFCSPFGLTSFFPDSVIENPYIPPVVLTDFLLSDKTAPIGDNSPLTQSISVTKSLTLHQEQNIFSFEFSALSYASPERNRYRYKLESLETKWNEKDSAHRTATYTTLPPGKYLFRVQGSNHRGAWNEEGASVRIVILPPWWATWQFRMGCAMLILISLCYWHYHGLQQITRQLNLRFEERLAERTRIAQELHDTLLQGFLSVSMQMHVAADGLAADSPVKQRLGAILELMGRVIEEGRNAVRGLRVSHKNSLDLEQAFSRIVQDLPTHRGIEFRVIVDGPARRLHPVVRDEVYRIGREAIINAFRHSGAKNIDVELEYEHRELRVVVRDDGCGIDPQVLRTGREGHWGLPGMRERAERIGGLFRVWSRHDIGTEVELSVPAHAAFQVGDKQRTWRWLAWRGREPAPGVDDGEPRTARAKDG